MDTESTERTERIIGKVSATEKNPSTTDEFYFWTDKGEILSPFDIVKVKHLPDNGSITYGVIKEIKHVTDAPSHFTSYISSDFGDTNDHIGNMNRLGMNYIKATVVHNSQNIYSPVLDGQQVSLCSDKDIKTALGLDNVKNPIVCGYLQMYKGDETLQIKVELNANFLIGPEGAHLNVSGISGLAAKTSYSMFLLNAIQQKSCTEDGSDVAFVFFNVKGRDLMAIDEPNTELKEADKKIYTDLLGLKPKPFQNVCYYYPYDNNRPEKVLTYSDIKDIKKQRAKGKAFTYKFTYEKNYEDLNLLLANENDSTGTMESCVNEIINKNGGFNNTKKWDSLLKTVEDYADGKYDKKSTTNQTNFITKASWRKLHRILNKLIKSQSIFHDNLESHEKVLTEEIKYKLTGGQVMVIDIANLDDNTKSFVFGSVIQKIWELKYNTDKRVYPIPKKIIIFIDELNKFASQDSIPKKSPILQQLYDITERGRSLGIVLFAAEQTRSVIYDRVKSNCATSAYGRTNSVETAKNDYKYIGETYKTMLVRLSAGEYIIENPTLRSLVNIKFPYNTYKQFPNG